MTTPIASIIKRWFRQQYLQDPELSASCMGFGIGLYVGMTYPHLLEQLQTEMGTEVAEHPKALGESLYQSIVNAG